MKATSTVFYIQQVWYSVGAKADANIDAELRLNCAQSTLLINLVPKS